MANLVRLPCIVLTRSALVLQLLFFSIFILPAHAQVLSSSTYNFSDVFSSTLTVSWGSTFPPSTTYYCEVSTDSIFGSVNESSDTLNLFATFGTILPLDANTTYYARVSTSASQSPTLVLGSTSTLANQPTSSAPSNVTQYSVQANWGTNSNPPGTQYKLTAFFCYGFPIIFCHYQFPTTVNNFIIFSPLHADATCEFQVRAINNNGIPTGWTILPSTMTLPPFENGETNVVTGVGGEVELVIPANALSEDFSVQFNTNPVTNPVTSPSLPSRITEANQKLSVNTGDYRRNPLPGKIVEIITRKPSGGPIREPIKAPVSLSISFEEEDGIVKNITPAVRVKTLAIYYLNEQDFLWVKIPTSRVDPATKKVTASISHLSVFALIGKMDNSLEDASAYPVPFQPSLGHEKINFTDLAQIATIRIFTVSGRLVQTLHETDGDGQLQWDVKNSQGSNVASGVYFYLIESATDKKTGKLMIIR